LPRQRKSATWPVESREQFQTLVERLSAGEATVSSGVVLALEHEGFVYSLVRHAAGGMSAREREVVALVARGFSNKLIATELDLSEHTVATYLRRLFEKFGVTSRAALVALAESR
jgi:DNA-binding CsgD family transcriptional regulator